MEIGTIVIHNERNNYWKVTDLGDTDGFVKYKRIPDGKEARLGVFSFIQRLRRASEEEVMMLNRVLPRLVPTVGATLETVERMYNNATGETGDMQGTNPTTRESEQQAESGLGILIQPKETDILENMILHPEAIESVTMGLNKVNKREKLAEVWKRPEASNKMVLNFYGKPGTGKTLAATCIAKKLNKPLYQVDYSQMISKWVGDTGKHIKQVFDDARAKDAVLFWDEADSLMSKRITSTDDGVGTSVNQNRNILMQELDRYNGVVIMTSNFFQNYDEALLRRIAQHVEFKLPDVGMRKKLIEAHFKNHDRMKEVDLEEIARLAVDFSGGDIKVLIENAEDHASMSDNADEWFITQDILKTEVKKISDAKKAHGGKNGGPKKSLGFHAALEELSMK